MEREGGRGKTPSLSTEQKAPEVPQGIALKQEREGRREKKVEREQGRGKERRRERRNGEGRE